MRVSYIPSQLEAAGTVALTLRASPGKLLFDDIKLVFSLVRLIPWILMPFETGNIKNKQQNKKESFWHILLHVTIFVYTISSIAYGVKIAAVTTGTMFFTYCVACWAVLMILCRPLNHGPRVLKSSVDLVGYSNHSRERWIFVNGICSGTKWLQESLDMISTIFKRPVVGIHNRSYGVVFDLIECLVQRDFSYMTSDIRITYNTVKEYLLDPDVDQVVVIAHSQGGIIISAAIDALYADLPPMAFDKLEIYTFGCAANHFNNPPRCTQCLNSSCVGGATVHLQNPLMKRQIAVVEHYVNEHDFVGRLGVLRFVQGKPFENQFVGKVFTRLGAPGHLFCQHYLGPMFSLEEGGMNFLDHVVMVDGVTSAVRGAAAVAELDAEEDGLVAGLKQSVAAEGNTVKDLSRLWKYRNGAVPE